MIYRFINWLNVRYNSYKRGTRFSLLIVFCVVFLLLLFLAIRYINFDVGTYSTKIPTHIGRPSGPEFKDSTKLKDR